MLLGEYKFLGDWRWLYAMEGFGEFRHWIYKVYILVIYCWSLLVLSVSLYGAYRILPDKERAIDGLHSALIALFAVWGLTTRMLTKDALNRTRSVVAAGFYRYPDPDKEIARLEASVGSEVRKSSRQFFGIMAFGGFCNVLIFPLSQLVVLSDQDYEKTVDLANPYYPHYLYLPWHTRSFTGFAGGFLINLLIFNYTYGMAIVMNEIYINLAVQLLVQLRILNHSIRTIRQRALRMYVNKFGQVPSGELIDHPDFQACLRSCLRQNISHHQVLIRFVVDVQPFIGSIFLLIVFLASIIFASIFYLIMKKPPLNCIANHMMTLFTEQSYTLYVCYFGEKIMEESGELFESLYSVEWPEGDRTFTRSLRMFRTFTRRPIRVKAHLLDVIASLETYAALMSAMYKLMNLMRQSDK